MLRFLMTLVFFWAGATSIIATQFVGEDHELMPKQQACILYTPKSSFDFESFWILTLLSEEGHYNLVKKELERQLHKASDETITEQHALFLILAASKYYQSSQDNKFLYENYDHLLEIYQTFVPKTVKSRRYLLTYSLDDTLRTEKQKSFPFLKLEREQKTFGEKDLIVVKKPQIKASTNKLLCKVESNLAFLALRLRKFRLGYHFRMRAAKRHNSLKKLLVDKTHIRQTT